MCHLFLLKIYMVKSSVIIIIIIIIIIVIIIIIITFIIIIINYYCPAVATFAINTSLQFSTGYR